MKWETKSTYKPRWILHSKNIFVKPVDEGFEVVEFGIHIFQFRLQRINTFDEIFPFVNKMAQHI